MQALSRITSTYVIGEANIRQDLIDNAVKYLKDYRMLKEQTNVVFLIPAYLAKINQEWKNRYYSDLSFEVSKIKPSDPAQHLLLELIRRVHEFGFFCDFVQLRFEKGCYYPIVLKWHQDGDKCDENKFISICYSNIADWSTKILNESSISKLGEIPENIDSLLLQRMENLATFSKHGVLYDVKNMHHRSPTQQDYMNHVDEDDYRLFIKFISFK